MADVIARDTRVDWAAIFAGATIATAIGLVLSAFGLGIGLSVTSPYEGEGSAPAFFAIGAGLWMLAIQLLAFGAGGYVAARLRARQPELTEHEVDVRDGLHGLIVWGVGVIAAAIISFVLIGGATTAAQTADGRGVVESVSVAANAEIDQAAAAERLENPEAADETLTERRAEVARKLAVISAFVTAATLLIGGVAAFFAAGIGGRHRDEAVQVRFFVLRRGKPVPVPPAAPPVAPTRY
jgi:hypothetical protein